MGTLQKIFYFCRVQKVGLKYALGFALGLSGAMGSSMLTACSDGDKTAGGGSSGTEAGNAIVACVMNGSSPAALAKVKITDSENLDFDSSTNGYIAETDQDGFVEFHNVAKGNYTLEAMANSKALQLQFTVSDTESLDLGIQELENTATISGSIAGSEEQGQLNGIVKVRGLDHTAKVTAGKFSLADLPAGPISLVYIPDAGEVSDTICGYAEGNPGKVSPAPSFAAESKALLFEDFNDSNSQHRFAPAFTPNGGWWYFSYDSSVTAEFEGKVLNFFPLEFDGSNGFAHFSVKFSEDSATSPWASFGVQIGDKSDDQIYTYDLTSVDSITFDVKGSGNVIMQFIDESREENDIIVATAEINLSEDWLHLAFDPKVIATADNSLNSVSMISWVFNSDAEFFIDNIKFVGADKNSIWKK